MPGGECGLNVLNRRSGVVLKSSSQQTLFACSETVLNSILSSLRSFLFLDNIPTWLFFGKPFFGTRQYCTPSSWNSSTSKVRTFLSKKCVLNSGVHSSRIKYLTRISTMSSTVKPGFTCASSAGFCAKSKNWATFKPTLTHNWRNDSSPCLTWIRSCHICSGVWPYARRISCLISSYESAIAAMVSNLVPATAVRKASGHTFFRSHSASQLLRTGPNTLLLSEFVYCQTLGRLT